MCRDLPGGQSFGIQRQHDLIDPGPPARSRGTSISTCPVASVRTVFGGVPLRILVESRSSEVRCFSRPRCSVIYSFNAVSSTDRVNCLRGPSGPGEGQTSRASRTSSSCALLGRGIRFLLFEVTSVNVVITPPSPLIFSQRVGAGNTVSGTVPWLHLLLLV